MTMPSLTAAPDHVAEAMLPRPFRVASKRHETSDTVTLRLEPEDGQGLVFTPGQFTMLYVFGVGEAPISISGDPAEPGILIHTVRSVGAVTRAIVDLTPGDQVGVRGPYGTGWPLESAEGGDVVVVAGGIGLAPVRPIVLELIAKRRRFGAVTIVYGARSPADLLYQEDLRAWRSRFDLDVEVTVDRSDEGWRGDVGVVTALLPRISFDPDATVAMLCGPEIMMRLVANELETQALTSDRIFVSLERNMKCAIGFCGHCQYGPDFVCRHGPVVSYSRVADRLKVPEL